VLAFQSLALTAKPHVKQAETPRVPEPVVQAFKQANVPMSAVSIMVTPLTPPSAGPSKPRREHHGHTLDAAKRGPL